MKEYEMNALAAGLSDVLGYGNIADIRPVGMTAAERGWSGAQVRRYRVTYAGGETRDMILKEARLKERMAMKALTEQGHENTPAAFSLDLETPRMRWMAQEDVGSVKAPPPGVDWLPKVASALANIHARNMGRGDEMPWLPHADRAYWKDYLLTRISVDHFETRVEQDDAFAKEFGPYLPQLRRQAEAFAGEWPRCMMSAIASR